MQSLNKCVGAVTLVFRSLSPEFISGALLMFNLILYCLRYSVGASGFLFALLIHLNGIKF